jgi:hypothetical protein
MSSQRDTMSWSPITHTLVEFYIHVLAQTPNPPSIRTLNTVYRHRLQKLALKGDESERKIASRQLAKWRVCVSVFGWVFANVPLTHVFLGGLQKRKKDLSKTSKDRRSPSFPRAKVGP